MKNVSGHIAWVRKMILEEGMASFARCPIPDKIPTKKCQSIHAPLPSTCQRERGEITNILMLIIINIMNQEAVI